LDVIQARRTAPVAAPVVISHACSDHQRKWANMAYLVDTSAMKSGQRLRQRSALTNPMFF
jgi:hypothetical protein